MQNIIQQAKTFILNYRILIILVGISLLSITVLIVGIGGRGDDKSDNTATQSKSVNTSAKKISELNLPESELNEIEQSIRKVARKNETKDFDMNRAIVRKNTIKIKNFEEFDLSYLSFIIDLPEHKQSFQVNHEWSSNNGNEYLSEDFKGQVYCIYDKSKIKYEEFDCKDSYSSDPKYKMVKEYARFSYDEDTNREITSDENDSTHIIVTAFDFSEENEEELVAYTQKWVESLGFSTDGFRFTANQAGGGVSGD